MFQDISTGAHDDLPKANALTRRMVMACGMSEQWGLYTVERGPQPLFFAHSTWAPQTYSEATAQTIAQAAHGIIEHMAQRARRQLLEVSCETLETLAQYLLVHETIDQSTLARLLAGLHPTMQQKPVAL